MQRASGHYEELEKNKCVCKSDHKKLRARHAEIEAKLVQDAYKGNFLNAAEQHAQKSMTLVADCSAGEAELSLLKLGEYFYTKADFANFEIVASRYLTIEQRENDEAYLAMKARTLIHLGIARAKDSARKVEARSTLLEGLALAKRLDKRYLLVKGEAALESLGVS